KRLPRLQPLDAVDDEAGPRIVHRDAGQAVHFSLRGKVRRSHIIAVSGWANRRGSTTPASFKKTTSTADGPQEEGDGATHQPVRLSASSRSRARFTWPLPSAASPDIPGRPVRSRSCPDTAVRNGPLGLPDTSALRKPPTTSSA